jgi:hypothetical protein
MYVDESLAEMRFDRTVKMTLPVGLCCLSYIPAVLWAMG